MSRLARGRKRLQLALTSHMHAEVSTLSCQRTQELIHGYLDGELDLARSLEVEQHMA